ncbi:MAG: SDR family oxidoreductase [Pelagibacterales bacterium]|nr:SDR family oxidoreductase [Pelagibacterales bacterium]MBL6874339.1 SDR family oxidoreductase [Flavobacteriales bacterium]
MIAVVTGSNGLLGQKIVHQLNNKGCKIIATSKGPNRNSINNFFIYEDLDITNKEQLSDVLNKYNPNVVFNTAAITNVDLCEQEKDLCDKVNVKAVKYLADLCLEIDSHLIHISTDFIFDGNDGPYKEDDMPCPLSYYGQSKLDAENILKSHNCKWTILRTILLFGVAKDLTKGNIVLWAKEQLENSKKINIIDDEFRAPTLADDLAYACVYSAINKVYGIYHTSGKDIMSIYDLVISIANYFKLDKNLVNRISSKELNQVANRPKKTGFVLEKAQEKLNYYPKSFNDSLAYIDKQLTNQNN